MGTVGSKGKGEPCKCTPGGKREGIESLKEPEARNERTLVLQLPQDRSAQC